MFKMPGGRDWEEDMKRFINNFTISLLESAGFIPLLLAGLQVVIIVFTIKGVEEIGYKVMPIIAGFGWFGTWAILWSKNARKNGGIQ